MEEVVKSYIKRLINRKIVAIILSIGIPEVLLIIVICFLILFVGASIINNEIGIEETEILGFEELSKYKGIIKEDNNGTYINWYFPIASGYKVSYNDDYDNPRPNGRSHKGNDLMCDKKTPIIAVESGKIERMGWEKLGGYRIGIRTEDNKYWYYAHMYNEHPYVKNLSIGSTVKAGEVIGYVGATGYGEIGTKDKFSPHLHIGLKINNKWVNPYKAIEVIERNKVSVYKKGQEFVSNNMPKVYIDYEKLDYNDLGILAKKYEGGGKVGTIGFIKGDYGGKSYGIYQIASGTRTMDYFLGWLSLKDEKLYKYLFNAKSKDTGYGENFDSAWEFLAKNYPKKFEKVQFLFIYETHYIKVIEELEGIVNLKDKSETLKCVIFSVAIQHGEHGATNLLKKIDYTKSDEVIIEQIYKERSKVDDYFTSQSEKTKDALINRFVNERNDALEMLSKESKGG